MTWTSSALTCFQLPRPTRATACSPEPTSRSASLLKKSVTFDILCIFEYLWCIIFITPSWLSLLLPCSPSRTCVPQTATPQLLLTTRSWCLTMKVLAPTRSHSVPLTPLTPTGSRTFRAWTAGDRVSGG